MGRIDRLKRYVTTLQKAIKRDGSSQNDPARLPDKSLVMRYPDLWVLGDPRLLDRPLAGSGRGV